MNNWILVISIIVASAMLILINFEPIYNYYTYAVPMKTAVLEHYIADFHYDPIDGKSHYYAAMENITSLKDGSLDIEFAPDSKMKDFKNVPYFVHFENIKKGQTFVVHCVNGDVKDSQRTGIGILKYLGTDILNDIPVYKFYHISASLASHMPCDYPAVIAQSVDVIPVDVPDGAEEKFLKLHGSSLP